MAFVESIDVPIGSIIPDFELKDAYGKLHKSKDFFNGKGLLVVFTCNHCPYAKAIWERFVRLSGYAAKLGINTVAINPNIHPDYPDDRPEMMIKMIEDLKIEFPYLADETQSIAKAFGAQCTPDIYLYDSSLKLVYHGRFDDNWKDEKAVKKQDLKDAIENLANGNPVSGEQFPSMGCSIKWK